MLKIMQKDDTHIVYDILAGDVNAFGELLSRHASRVRSVVGRIVASVEDAEELTQNVFVKAYEHLADFDERKSGFATWLNRIAYNEAVDYLRRKSPVSVLSIDEADWDLQMEGEEDADEAFDDFGNDRVELLRRAVLALPPQDRMLVHLYYNDDLPLREIGFILDRQPAYLATRLQRIRKRLYKTIKQLELYETK